jgi:hypothetical protein
VKKPFIRVTKWIGDIPVEAVCTACTGVHFRAESASHRPQREEYQKSLQSQFDAHFKSVHMSEESSEPPAAHSMLADIGSRLSFAFLRVPSWSIVFAN